MGHWVSKNGIAVMPDKVEKVLNLERPSDVNGVLSFWELVRYYRLFIPRYAHKSLPLTELMCKKLTWQWGDEQERAFVVNPWMI